MGAVWFFVVTTVGLLSLLQSTEANGVSEITRRDLPDAFQIFLHLEDVLAISDADDDGLFECVEAIRSDNRMEPKMAAYVFLFKGHHGTEKKNVTFHVRPGATPDRIIIYFDNHTEEEFEAQYLYTDYQTCAIVKGSYEGERCLLLVSKEMAEDVPESCLANFADTCGVASNLYSKELCPDDE
ncbi:uncharacterized protein [Dermacentor andersoni]|uniref:uncharacterized protein n=1 Tax=Dermacentor andersoni TaxID=34620 RepID=UPI002417D782|nr:uncharacterized protein LOC129382419 [Dermacentor andersoni]